MPRSSSPSSASLRAAFAPYLAELSGCCCAVCRDVVYRGNFPRRALDEPAYWRAVSEQLRVASSGEHHRVDDAAWVAAQPPARYRAPERVMSGATPLGIGIHPALDSLMHRATSTSAATSAVACAPAAPPPGTVCEPDRDRDQQLVLFSLPAR